MSILKSYFKSTPMSKRLFDEASRYMANSSTNWSRTWPPYHVYAKRGKGSHLWDLDGNEYVDFFFNATVLILGHANPKVMSAVKDQIENGLVLGPPHESEIELAERLVNWFPGGEMVRFYASGTEACMHSIRLARAYTGKDKFIMFQGHYHGHSDDLDSGTYPDAKGIARSSFGSRIVLPYNNAEIVEKSVRENKDELAAIILEPNWTMRAAETPKEGFLEALRQITERYGLLLIFDEVKTGFRTPGGAQQLFKVVPDITVTGKAIGGGFPLAAITAREDIIKQYSYPPTTGVETTLKAKVPHSGTFNSHPVTYRAGIATIDQLKPKVYEHMDKIGRAIREGLIKISDDLGIKYQVVGSHSVFQVHMIEKKIESYQDYNRIDKALFSLFRLGLMNRGVFLMHRGYGNVSAATTEEDVLKLLDAVRDTLTTMRLLIEDTAPGLIARR